MNEFTKVFALKWYSDLETTLAYYVFFFLALFENPSDLTSLTNILKVPFFFTIIFEFFCIDHHKLEPGVKG